MSEGKGLPSFLPSFFFLPCLNRCCPFGGCGVVGCGGHAYNVSQCLVCLSVFDGGGGGDDDDALLDAAAAAAAPRGVDEDSRGGDDDEADEGGGGGMKEGKEGGSGVRKLTSKPRQRRGGGLSHTG